MPDEQVLRLSDSFPEGAVSDVEVRVRMLNINHGRNLNIVDSCAPLSEYSFLIAEIREVYKAQCLQKFGESSVPKGTPKEIKSQILMESVDLGLNRLPEDAIICPFLMKHRAEVKNMLLTEYNEAKAMKLFFLDGERKGIKKGLKEGRNLSYYEMVQDGDITPQRAAQKLAISPDQVISNMLLHGYKLPDRPENPS